MPATAIPARAVGRNVAQDIAVLATAADTSNFNSFPNNGRTVVAITTGATPGTVNMVISKPDAEGRVVADVNVLDHLGGALAANKTYIVGVGGPAAYGDIVTIKANQATTKILPLQVV